MLLFMSTSMVLCDNLKLMNQNLLQTSLSISWRNPSNFFVVPLSCKRKGFSGFVANAANNNKKYSSERKRKRSWWQKFFFDDDGNWLGLEEDDMEEGDDVLSESEEVSGGGKFEAWKRRAEAIIELREAQEDMRNEESRRWEDWIVVGDDNKHGASKDWDDDGVGEKKENGLVQSVKDLVLGREDEDILYEDRVFRYASLNSAKFVALLILVPLALDFVVHDYVLMPFLDRYVKTVPLAAEILDVRRNQKLEMVKRLKVEKARIHFEVEIGKSPPLSDEELWWELRHKAYHSESGWQTLLEIIVEHYGLQVDQSAITIFVCLIPVVIDACVKLWLFKFLPRLSPRVANLFQEMKRH
ncbi:hypothetical protein DITRI_Ditri05aG0099800 [Diplodiscus trichospermus]